MEVNPVDPKIVGRIHKLMALARNGAATEAEAELALEHAQRMMQEYNLSIAEIEASGGASDGVWG